MFKYKKDFNLDQRRQECERIKNKYQDRIPVICEKSPTSRLKDVRKTKYLVPYDMPVSQFCFLIRKGITLSQECSLYLLVNGTYSVMGNQSMKEVYLKHADKEDGFLYIMYAEEESWG